MTLYYTKSDLATQHNRLATAYQKMKDAGIMPETIKDSYYGDPSQFVGANGISQHLKGGAGRWKLDISGICPGTSCSEGGPLVDKHLKLHAPVPEQRCALCRFRITGPQFLLGLTIEANNLIYRIKKSANKIKALSERAIESNCDSERLELNQEIETLNNMTNLDWQEWQAIVLLINECNNKAAPDSRELAWNDLHAGLEESNEFTLLHSITIAMGMFPAYAKVQNREAMLEKHELINAILQSEGLPAFLLQLPEKKKLQAGNSLSELLIKMIPPSGLEQITVSNGGLPDFPKLPQTFKFAVKQITGN